MDFDSKLRSSVAEIAVTNQLVDSISQQWHDYCENYVKDYTSAPIRDEDCMFRISGHKFVKGSLRDVYNCRYVVLESTREVVLTRELALRSYPDSYATNADRMLPEYIYSHFPPARNEARYFRVDTDDYSFIHRLNPVSTIIITDSFIGEDFPQFCRYTIDGYLTTFRKRAETIVYIGCVSVSRQHAIYSAHFSGCKNVYLVGPKTLKSRWDECEEVQKMNVSFDGYGFLNFTESLPEEGPMRADLPLVAGLRTAFPSLVLSWDTYSGSSRSSSSSSYEVVSDSSLKSDSGSEDSNESRDEPPFAIINVADLSPLIPHDLAAIDTDRRRRYFTIQQDRALKTSLLEIMGNINSFRVREDRDFDPVAGIEFLREYLTKSIQRNCELLNLFETKKFTKFDKATLLFQITLSTLRQSGYHPFNKYTQLTSRENRDAPVPFILMDVPNAKSSDPHALVNESSYSNTIAALRVGRTTNFAQPNFRDYTLRDGNTMRFIDLYDGRDYISYPTRPHTVPLSGIRPVLPRIHDFDGIELSSSCLSRIFGCRSQPVRYTDREHLYLNPFGLLEFHSGSSIGMCPVSELVASLPIEQKYVDSVMLYNYCMSSLLPTARLLPGPVSVLMKFRCFYQAIKSDRARIKGIHKVDIINAFFDGYGYHYHGPAIDGSVRYEYFLTTSLVYPINLWMGTALN